MDERQRMCLVLIGSDSGPYSLVNLSSLFTDPYLTDSTEQAMRGMRWRTSIHSRQIYSGHKRYTDDIPFVGFVVLVLWFPQIAEG